MEVDLKRVARLEYLKLRQSKQTEKIDAVKVRFDRKSRMKLHTNTDRDCLVISAFTASCVFTGEELNDEFQLFNTVRSVRFDCLNFYST